MLFPFDIYGKTGPERDQQMCAESMYNVYSAFNYF